MRKKVTVDRTDGSIIVCVDENETVYEIKNSESFLRVREGDILLVEVSDRGDLTIIEKDITQTESKKAEMKARLSNLFENKKRF